MNSINVEMLQIVAQGLEELADEMVFVGELLPNCTQKIQAWRKYAQQLMWIA